MTRKRCAIRLSGLLQWLILLVTAAELSASSTVAVISLPRATIVPVGQTQQISAIVVGLPEDSDTGLLYYVDGIAGGDRTVGTVDREGVYQAPMVVPARAQVMVLAVSRADPAKSASTLIHIVPKVNLNAYAAFLYPGEHFRLQAAVSGAANSTIRWYVNDVLGGNPQVGAIAGDGVYTAPNSVPSPGYVKISARSAADERGFAVCHMKLYQGKHFSLYPARVSLLPNASFQFVVYTNVYWRATSPSRRLLFTFSVDGVPGGNSAVGTVDSMGLYTAPAGPGTHTLVARSRVDAGFEAAALVTVTSNAGPSQVVLADMLRKIRPYDVITGADTLELHAAKGQYVSWQQVITANGEDLTDVDVSIGDFRDGKGNVIRAASHTWVFYEQAMNVVYPSLDNSIGEWPDPLVPKVDLLAGERRDAFPFTVKRVSPAYRIHPFDDTQVNVTNRRGACEVRMVSRNGGVGTITCAGFHGFVAGQQVVNSGLTNGSFNGTFIITAATADAFSFDLPGPDMSPASSEGRAVVYEGYGSAVSGGTYAGSVLRHFVLRVDGPGQKADATFRWSVDGGNTWRGNATPMRGCPCFLQEGVTVDFADWIRGRSFELGDQFWIWAGPFRNQAIWADVLVPRETAPGAYTATVTVAANGRPRKQLSVKLVVHNVAVAASPPIPVLLSPYWPGLSAAHTGASGGQVPAIHNKYSALSLVNRLGGAIGSQQWPDCAFRGDGTVSRCDYRIWEADIRPIMTGAVSPNGEKPNAMWLPHPGSTDSERYFAILDIMKNDIKANGWERTFADYTADEPGTDRAKWTQAFRWATISRNAAAAVGVLPWFALVTDGIDSRPDLAGILNRLVPNIITLDPRIGRTGARLSKGTRSHHDAFVQGGGELWWYDSCTTTGCGADRYSGAELGYPQIGALDEPTLRHQVLGWLSFLARVSGFLYYDIAQGNNSYASSPQPKPDVWDSVYYFGANGSGTLFYPGRPSCTLSPACRAIGGKTDIPVESLRAKALRDAMYMWELARKLQQSGEQDFAEKTIMTQAEDTYTWNPDPAAWNRVRPTILERLERHQR